MSLTLKCMAKITLMTSKWQNTSKNDTSAPKLADNEVLHDCLCWMTKKFKNHLIIMLISIIMLNKKKADFFKITLNDQNSTRDGSFSQNYAKKSP